MSLFTWPAVLPRWTTWRAGSSSGASTRGGWPTRSRTPACCSSTSPCTRRASGRPPADRPSGDPGAPVIDVDRGGKITWHGPGPARRLPDREAGRTDRRGRLRAGARAGPDPHLRRIRCAPRTGCAGRSGAWVPGARPDRAAGPQDRGDRGPGLARGHHAWLRTQLRLRPGLVRPIVPCGITDVGSTTSLSAETGRHITVADVLPAGRAGRWPTPWAHHGLARRAGDGYYLGGRLTGARP